jgi:hypothetical protein
MNRIILIATIVCLFLVATAASGQGVATAPATVASGFLTCSNDNDDAIRLCPFRLHYIELVAGRTYCMRMESSEFQPFLMIEDMHGNPMAMDIDDFNTMPGCMVFRPSTTATYRMIASASLPIREGFYRVTMRELPSVFEVSAELASTDPMNSDCHERFYDVPLIEGRRYVIDLGSREFDAYVKLMTTENVIVAFEDESSPVRGARIVFTAPRTETYRIVATSLMPNSTGTFTLNVSECE